jgi:hypothetical protein
VSFYDIAKKLQDLPGDLTNQVVGAAVHADLGQKYSEAINGALARQYIKGRTIAEERQAQGKSVDDLAGLGNEEASAVRAYQKVHNDLPAKIPFVDRDALVREVERNIEVKAKMPQPPARDKIQLAAAEKNPPAREGALGERPVKEPLPPPAKDAALKAPGAAAPKEAGVKVQNVAASREAAMHAQTGPRPGDTTTKGSPAKESASKEPTAKQPAAKEPAAKDQSDRPAKTTAEHQITQGQIGRGTEQTLTKSMPKPNEPQARELQNREVAGSADRVSVQKAIPQPHPPAGLDQRQAQTNPARPLKENLDTVDLTKHLPIKFAAPSGDGKLSVQKGQLQPESFVSKAATQAKRPLPVVDHGPNLALPGDDGRPLVPLNKWPDATARLVVGADGKSPQSKTDILAPRPAQPDRAVPTIRAIDSKVFQVLTALQALPFGRQFGQVEKTSPLIPSQNSAGREPPEQSGKTIALTRDLKLHPEPRHIAGGETTSSASMSHRIDGSHSAVETHSASQTHSTSQPHSTDAGHSAGEIESTDAAKPITIIDKKNTAVTPFGQDKDDIKQFEHEPGSGVRTYIIKGFMPDKRYITGGELAFVAIMALASASRVRPGENAAEQGLIQTRREYILVEEEPWLNPDYRLPPNTGLPTKRTMGESQDSDKQEGGAKEIEPETNSRGANGQKTNQQRKVLLRPQIMVQEGDNLCEMAEALFNDSRYGHLIADLNAKTIDESFSEKTRIIRLTTRQRLSLPVYQDTTQFDAGRLGEIGGWTLITIVESTAIDRELLNEGLSTMLGINSKNRDPLDKNDSGGSP